MHGAKSRNFSTNSLFGAFSMAVIGWGLLQAWGMHVDAAIHTHVLIALPGLTLSGTTFHRYRQHWPIETSNLAGRRNGQGFWTYRAIACCLLLAAIGAAIGLLVAGGFVFVLVLAALTMISFPWTRIPECRNHFFMMAAIVVAGAAGGLAAMGRPIHPLYYPAAAWILLIVSCSAATLTIIMHGNRRERMPAPT